MAVGSRANPFPPGASVSPSANSTVGLVIAKVPALELHKAEQNKENNTPGCHSQIKETCSPSDVYIIREILLLIYSETATS